MKITYGFRTFEARGITFSMFDILLQDEEGEEYKFSAISARDHPLLIPLRPFRERAYMLDTFEPSDDGLLPEERLIAQGMGYLRGQRIIFPSGESGGQYIGGYVFAPHILDIITNLGGFPHSVGFYCRMTGALTEPRGTIY